MRSPFSTSSRLQSHLLSYNHLLGDSPSKGLSQTITFVFCAARHFPLRFYRAETLLDVPRWRCGVWAPALTAVRCSNASSERYTLSDCAAMRVGDRRPSHSCSSTLPWSRYTIELYGLGPRAGAHPLTCRRPGSFSIRIFILRNHCTFSFRPGSFLDRFAFIRAQVDSSSQIRLAARLRGPDPNELLRLHSIWSYAR